MQEFTTVSSSTYEPAALAARLTEKSAEGWQVLSIVTTGADLTAFLVRDLAAAADPGVAAEPTNVASADPVPGAESEPAGWAVAPAAATTPQPTSISTAYTASAAVQPSAPASTAPSVPAGWYADPSGRYELRYWDGTAWTEHVSRAGQQYTDPPVA